MLKTQSYLTPFPSQGNYILACLDDDNVKIEQLRATVEEHGILLRYFQKPSMHNFVRITVGLPEHTELLAQALARVRS